MNKIFIFLLAFYCLACNTASDKNSSLTEHQPDNVKGNSTVIDSFLIIEILAFIETIDANHFALSNKIIGISFVKEEEDCFLFISPAPFYDRRYWNGYILINERMLVFYETNSSCNKGIVKEEKLLQEEPFGYPNENTRHALTSYDPWGWKYKIYSADNLKLVHEGYF